MDQTKEHSEAHCRALLSEQDQRPDLWAQLATILHQTGRTREAMTALTRAIALDPRAPAYRFSLGLLHIEQAKPSAAAVCFEQALALDPKNAAVCLRLGDSLMDAHHYDRAVAVYRQALTLRIPFPEAHNNLAGALLHLGDAHGALAECRRALAARPDYVVALNTLGSALGKTGLLDEAIKVLRQAITLRPNYANAYHNLGNILDQAQRVDEARQAYRAALSINPGLDEARYNLAALGALPPPPRTPRHYLLRLFDSYATSFDEHLVDTLNYHVPEQLVAAVLAVRPNAANLDIIDPGCGTGLVGLHCRRFASRLVGIDVSARMIQFAQRRQIYDELIHSDLVDYLNARQEPCDLVLAADVFIYSGELLSVFQLLARLLRPGGLFAFSLETTELADYVLQPNRRYAHSPGYIQRLADQTGLFTVARNPVKLRRHGENHAEGLIMVLRKNESTG